jgi:hypothetical protein
MEETDQVVFLEAGVLVPYAKAIVVRVDQNA